jgi:hypothetical protein
MPRGFLEADTSEVVGMSERFSIYLAAELRALRSEAQTEVRNVVADILWDIAISANNFPEAYADHLVGVFQRKAFNLVTATNNQLIWTFDWERELGDRISLSLGYHQEAALKGGGHHPLGDPWIGGDLKNAFPTRYKAWQVVANNGSWTTQKVSKKTGKLGKPHTWTPKYTAEETYEARTEIWGWEMAPEWIILDQGTTFYPPVAPTAVTTNINVVATNLLATYTARAVDMAQLRADQVSSGAVRKQDYQSRSEFLSEISNIRNRTAGGQFAPGYK